MGRGVCTIRVEGYEQSSPSLKLLAYLNTFKSSMKFSFTNSTPGPRFLWLDRYASFRCFACRNLRALINRTVAESPKSGASNRGLRAFLWVVYI